VARRCDYTVDKKRVNSGVPKHLFLEGVEQPKISPKKPGNALSNALLMSRFQNFAADAAKKKYETALRAVVINEVIEINSGPNILRSFFFFTGTVRVGIGLIRYVQWTQLVNLI